jgi:hypothetical protein
MKLFKIKDKSGRGYGITNMNQTQLLNFMDAGNYEKDKISNLNVGSICLEFPALKIQRIK